jgi:hypothetical protein
VPRNRRPNPILLRQRSLVLLATAGVTVLGVSVLATLGAHTDVIGPTGRGWLAWLIQLASFLIIGAMLTLLFRLATTRDHPLKNAAPGAFTLALMWQSLQWIGAIYVTNVIQATHGMNQTFALVLGLMGLIYIASVMGVLGIEVNVVLARRLWPRALLTPFTDRVDLTEADRRAYAGYALMQRHKGFQTVAVTFEGRDGHAHEIVMDPSWLAKTRKLRIRRDDLVPDQQPTEENDDRAARADD